MEGSQIIRTNSETSGTKNYKEKIDESSKKLKLILKENKAIRKEYVNNMKKALLLKKNKEYLLNKLLVYSVAHQDLKQDQNQTDDSN